MAIAFNGKKLVEARLNGKKLAEAWINGHRVFPSFAYGVWTKMGNFGTEQLRDFGYASDNDFIAVYLFGGTKNDSTALPLLTAYDSRTDTFSTILDNLKGRETWANVMVFSCYDEELFAFGGMRADQTTAVKKWTTRILLYDGAIEENEDIPGAVMYHCAARPHNSQDTYVIGVSNDQGIAIFHENTRTWSTGPTMPEARISACAVGCDLPERIYIIGGNVYGEESASMIRFDPVHVLSRHLPPCRGRGRSTVRFGTMTTRYTSSGEVR